MAAAVPSQATYVDCLVIGGGPAGLTAAIYLARFRLSVVVIDARDSRARSIPLTRNHAGFPAGIRGSVLVARMRRQATRYGAEVRSGSVNALERRGRHLVAKIGSAEIHASAVLLATGVVNRRPPMIDAATHARALASGRLRYCPVCDGFEVTDQRVAVLGTGARGVNEALFLRSYTPDISLVASMTAHELTGEQRTQLADAGVTLAGVCTDMALSPGKIDLVVDDDVERFDSLYPALGSDSQSALAAHLGAATSPEGCLIVDAHQRTTVAGLYAAGDVVLGLDQISHAMGEGGVAATTMRNDLAKLAPMRR